MNEFKQLLQLDFPTVIMGVVVILVAIKYSMELFESLAGKFGLTTKGSIAKQKDHQLLEDISRRVSNIETESEENTQRDKDLVEVLNDVSSNINTIKEHMNNLETKVDNTTVASRESLADRINQKYKYYLRINGIPEDEVDEFVELHKAYKGVGGNHSGDAKFKYCIEQLPILPAENKLDYGKQ